MKTREKIMLAVNTVFIAAIFILNYFYQSNGFDFTLKCICSGAFALLGLINLSYALIIKEKGRGFFASMALGLVLAFLGDYLIGYDFIVGAATFALGHICFVFAYCLASKIRILDIIISTLLFTGGSLFLMTSPLLTFEVPVFRVVCVIYALIISAMLGKALGNFFTDKNTFTAVVALASALFFFSDLMLVFDWFIGRWSWTDNACMGTYYPALCFLALSMILKIFIYSGGKRKNENQQNG